MQILKLILTGAFQLGVVPTVSYKYKTSCKKQTPGPTIILVALMKLLNFVLGKALHNIVNATQSLMIIYHDLGSNEANLYLYQWYSGVMNSFPLTI